MGRAIDDVKSIFGGGHVPPEDRIPQAADRKVAAYVEALAPALPFEHTFERDGIAFRVRVDEVSIAPGGFVLVGRRWRDGVRERGRMRLGFVNPPLERRHRRFPTKLTAPIEGAEDYLAAVRDMIEGATS